MARKTVPFNKSGIAKLPNNKPVVYTIESGGGKKNYVGIAKRGRVQERVQEHLPEAKHPVPGARVRVEQMSTVQDARRREEAAIRRSQPTYNKNHK